MSIVTIRNRRGEVWTLYGAVMASKQESYAVLRDEMRRVFSVEEKNGLVTANGPRDWLGRSTRIFIYIHKPNAFSMGCQRFDRDNMRKLRKWALGR